MESTFDTLWNRDAWDDPAVQEALQREEYEQADDLHEQAYDRLADEAEERAEQAARDAYDAISDDQNRD